VLPFTIRGRDLFCIFANDCGIIYTESGYAKIAEKNTSSLISEFSGFDVTMDDARLVDVGKCDEEFADDDDGVSLLDDIS
jgi:hypothetical protein